MSESEQRDIEDLLRQALQQHAGQIHPMGDGLERIRTRVSRRHTMLSWLRPAAAVAGATMVVAGAVLVPTYLRGHDEGSADRTSALTAASSTTPRVKPVTPADPTAVPNSPESMSTMTSQSTPDADVSSTNINNDPSLPDMTTVWPYGTRSEGTRRADNDVATKARPTLRDPQQTALRFVQSFVGSVPSDDSLVAERGEPMGAGIGVVVSRESSNGGRNPVSLVYLVRVRRDNDSPYVVVNARAPESAGQQASMTVDSGGLQGTDEITVTGSVAEQAAPGAALIKIVLHEPGENETVASNAVPLTGLKADTSQDWTTSLTPTRRLGSKTGTVAAWTVDVDNHLLGFVAVPTDPTAD